MWLDYAEEKERVEQIAEFQTLLRRLHAMSILKLTLNANPENLGGVVKSGVHSERIATLTEQFGNFLPADFSEYAVSEEGFPGTLLHIVAAASREALATRNGWTFQLLSAFSYRDSRQEMFTATGIVGVRKDIALILERTPIRKWDFKNLDCSPPMRISVPELTIKERIHINQILPKYSHDLKAIHKALGFRFDASESVSESMLRMYVSFYHHYPQFGRVAF